MGDDGDSILPSYWFIFYWTIPRPVLKPGATFDLHIYFNFVFGKFNTFFDLMMAASNKDAVIALYTQRANNYDSSEKMSSPHAQLGKDFVNWLKPQEGDKVLDLACGTGSVTFPMATAVGKDGLVVGIDITAGMLDVGRAKLETSAGPEDNATAPIAFFEGDITSVLLKELPSVRAVLDRGGFDIITCCSALILLPDPAAAIELWSSLLKKGGKIVVDVPTEYRSLQYLLTDTVPDQLGIKKDWDRTWVKDEHTLTNTLVKSGLEILHSWKTESLTPVREFEGNEETGLQSFDKEILNHRQYQDPTFRSEARKIWPQIWRAVVGKDGKYIDSHCLYVSIGVKL